MVSFWPFGQASDSESPAHFEKVLAAISEKISAATSRLEAQLRRSRRWKVVWTLYTTFAYTLYAIIATYVLGWKQWGVVEYTIMSGAPVTIYVIRAALASFFSYQVSKTQRTLEGLNDEREKTIEKLKEATKYNSTQRLLKKYGASPPSSPSTNSKGRAASSGKKNVRREAEKRNNQSRTNLPPPPTANIHHMDELNTQRPSDAIGGKMDTQARNINRKFGASPPATAFSSPSPNPAQPMNLGAPIPQGFPARMPVSPYAQPKTMQSQYPAYPQSQRPQQQQLPYEPRWYDRFIDVLLGEDETSPKNRMALLCRNCRTVNGLAPPGVASPNGVGIWRCMYCQEWNGDGSDKMGGDGGGGGGGDATEHSSPLDSNETGRGEHLHGRQRSMSHPVSPTDGLGGTEAHGRQNQEPDLADRGDESHKERESDGGDDSEENPDRNGKTAADESEGDKEQHPPSSSGTSSPARRRLRSQAT